MRTKLVHQAEGQRTYVAVLDTGDEVCESLQRLAEKERLSAAQITAIGALRDATLAFWNWDTKEYEEIPIDSQAEVVSLNGDIALGEAGKPKLHIHTVLGLRDGSTRGGHLLAGHVRPTLEVIISESPAHLRRKTDPETGLNLIRLDGERG
jgi:predicted DNA-binding protein with PD1-like motif